jgi:hypothetical protein
MFNKPVLSFVALVAIAACSGPSASSSSAPASAPVMPDASQAPSTSVATPAAQASASVAETPSSFMSPLYGYTLTLPAGWSVGAAMMQWDGKSQPGHEEPVVDKFGGPTTASAWAFAGPVTLDTAGFAKDRIAANARDHGDTCPATPDVNEPIQIGGEPGVFLAWNCGILINQAVIVHEGTGFTVAVRDPGVHAATDAADRALLEDLLNSVTLPSSP